MTDIEYRNALRQYLESKSYDDYMNYAVQAIRHGYDPLLPTCSVCSRIFSPLHPHYQYSTPEGTYASFEGDLEVVTQACSCGALVCSDCKGRLDEIDEPALCRNCAIGECYCGAEIDRDGILCDNCKLFVCEECACICKDCLHKHVLCASCNDDAEFMRKCYECENWFCTQCRDGCYEYHLEDCYN